MPCDSIKQAVREREIGYDQYTLARFVARSIPSVDELSLWLVILVNRQLQAGNICLPYDGILPRLVEHRLYAELSAAELEARIDTSPVIGGPQDELPLVAFGQRLYLHRYFHNERKIGDTLLRLARQTDSVDGEAIAELGAPMNETGEIDFQRLAALVAGRHHLAVISGGPGTGKTYTVGRILRLLQRRNPQLRVHLAAPTGKAAARLGQSLQQHLQASTAVEAVTLHRLLGIDRHSNRPRRHRERPLDCDVLVIDEASMIDQQIMAMLCDALPPAVRLILLGDKDQLASVEAGAVFADICGDSPGTRFSAEQRNWLSGLWSLDLPEYGGGFRLADNLVVLEHSYRFAADSAIGRLGRMINRGDSGACIQILGDEALNHAELTWRQPAASDLPALLEEQARQHFLPMLDAGSAPEAFACFHRFRILAAVWHGETGVHVINRIIERYLLQHLGLSAETEYFAGKPLMMLRNSFQYDIFNGDIGILWPDDSGELVVWFETRDGGYRYLALSQLPPQASAYAMTVHKSQGSEFARVLLLLPEEDSELLTRELVYTAVTRTSSTLEVWAQADIIAASIQRITRRVSGLGARLANT